MSRVLSGLLIEAQGVVMVLDFEINSFEFTLFAGRINETSS